MTPCLFERGLSGFSVDCHAAVRLMPEACIVSVDATST